MSSPTLHLRLDAIARRYVWARTLNLLGWAWCALALAAWGVVSIWIPSGTAGALWLVVIPGLATGILFLVAAAAKQGRPTPTQIALRIEELAPEADARLITAVEQTPDLATGRFTILQQQVLAEAATYLHGDWPRRLIPAWKLALPSGLIALDLILLLAVLFSGSLLAPTELAARVTVAAQLSGDAALPVNIEPGDVELERGSSLLIIGRFRDDLPQRVQLHVESTANGREVLPMSKALDDPIFGARLTSVGQDLTYHVEFDGRKTRPYRVTVFDLPALVRGDLVLRAPDYTGQPLQRIPNAFEATVVERTEVTIECRVNKPLESVHLLDQNDKIRGLTSSPSDPLLWTYTFTPEASTRLKLVLLDDRGRRNRDPDQFRIEVVPNQPPKLELAFPGRDVRVSPLEELLLEGRVVDDFGLDEFGLVLTVAGREPRTIPLGKDISSNKSQQVSWLQALEELEVAPDDLVSYYLYAVDRDADGKPRRVTGDLFFAEVRPFEETFRQMDSPPGGGAQSGGPTPAGNQMENLVQVQKQIVSATWNLIRQNQQDWQQQGTEQLGVVSESQASNKTKLLELMVHLSGAAQQRVANLAVEQMTAAETQLQAASGSESRDPLAVAVAAEQSAYQALLKMRAREHQVTQGQQSGGGSGGGASPSEQQLQQLELSEKQNRYETRSAANSENSSNQQQDLGTLDRLKELARRQGDLSDKLRELDAALRLAQSAAEREEIERQLKRLRDEQQQLLQDADELRNRLAQSNRQEELRETREQLENTRRRMVDAAESLQEGQLSQALNSATRAERELDTLQQDFRQQTSARFAETMRELREAAREVTERESQLAQELAGQKPADEKPSLRPDRSRQDLQGDFEQQRAAVEELLNRARQVVQEAETAEPLLSQQLYDTLRKTREDQLEPALEAVPQLLQRGFMPEAQKVEEQVRQGLERLQAGVNQAAESVLGSEVEGLKRAKLELAELSQQLQNELRQQMQRDGAAPGESAEGQGSTPGEGAPGSEPGTSDRPGSGKASGDQPGESQADAPAGQQSNGAGQGTPPSAGQGQGQGQQPGEGAPGRGAGEGQEPSETPGNGQGQGQSPGSGQGQGAPSATGGAPDGANAAVPPGTRPGGLRGSPSASPSPGSAQGGSERGGFGGGPGGQGGPISGDGYRDWSERLRDVETLVADPDLQAEVSKLREQARSLRAESKRHSQAPNWGLVQTSLYEPMVELQRRLAEEVAKRESDDALVPIDRDPVPARYKELVRSYYERLGRGAE